MASGSVFPEDVGYDAMKAYHDTAYDVIGDALSMDETGEGDIATVIDLYSRGVTELEKGVMVTIHPSDVNASKAERLRERMKKNLDMTRGRVEDLLEGKGLKGSTSAALSSIHSDSGQPPPRPITNKTKKPKVVSSKCDMSVKAGPTASSSSSSTRKVATDPSNRKSKTTEATKTIQVKGVDPSLVKLITDEILDKDTNVKLSDIVGLTEAKSSLNEAVILPAVNPGLFKGLRTPPKGLLLFGPPGNGKTMLAKAVAHESKSTFFNITSSSLTSKYVGEGEKLVKALFAVAREYQPSIIFIDEIDSLLSRRSDKEHDAMRRLKNEFLSQSDGISSDKCERILVMGATNRPYDIDEAALRRFPKRIYISLPSDRARVSVIKKLLTGQDHTLTEVEIDTIARRTDRYSFSDMTELAKEAALGPIRDIDTASMRTMKPDQVSPITFADFRNAISTIRSSVSPDDIKRLNDWNLTFGMKH